MNALSTYLNKPKRNNRLATKVLETTGVNFRRQFDLGSYKEFFQNYGIGVKEYVIVDGRMPCAFAIIQN